MFSDLTSVTLIPGLRRRTENWCKCLDILIDSYSAGTGRWKSGSQLRQTEPWILSI